VCVCGNDMIGSLPLSSAPLLVCSLRRKRCPPCLPPVPQWRYQETHYMVKSSIVIVKLLLSISVVYRIAENSREKTFANFAVLWLYAKVFSVKFGAWHPLALQKRAIRENHYFHQFAKVFSLESFPLYGSYC